MPDSYWDGIGNMANRKNAMYKNLNSFPRKARFTIKRRRLKTRKFAKMMRNNPTIQEDMLYQSLRKEKLGVRIHRQAVILGWIADLYIPSKLIVIEVDGRNHEKQKTEDQIRDQTMNGSGITVLRFWNEQIVPERIRAVIDAIKDAIKNKGMNS